MRSSDIFLPLALAAALRLNHKPDNDQVFDMVGNIAFEGVLKNIQIQQFDLSRLVGGMYYVRVYNKEKSFAKKIVIQR